MSNRLYVQHKCSDNLQIKYDRNNHINGVEIQHFKRIFDKTKKRIKTIFGNSYLLSGKIVILQKHVIISKG